MVKKYSLTKIKEAGSIDKIDDARFSIEYRNLLNPAQYEAVSAVNGNYLLIAGAGTGKTRTLVFRVARLVEAGIPPESILLLTFTRKAAKEMLDRASLLLDSRCNRISGGTFHSFANITLRKYGSLINIDPGFTILDQGDSEDIINVIRGQLNLDQIKKRFPKKSTLFKFISLSRNTAIPLETIVEDEYPHFFPFIDKILDIAKVYASYKKRNNNLDYDDLLFYLTEFLKSNQANSFLSKIEFVMIDEYQDTNILQYELVKALTRLNNNLMVVGDDSQSIYSFRGANFKNIIEFPKHFNDAKVIKIEENYRSTQEILNFANHIIDGAIEKFPKNLYTRQPDGELPAIVTAENENMQSQFIVNRVLELREEGVALEDIAILFRSSYHSFDLEVELNKANIPYIKFGGIKFVEASHVKDMIAFLRVVANHKDFISWYRILMLHEGIGPKKAQAIIDILSQPNFTFDFSGKMPVTKNVHNQLLLLFELLNSIKKGKKSPTEKTELIYTYYTDLFKAKYDDHNKRKKDIETLINMSVNYKSLDSFLSDLALEPPQDSVNDLSDTKSDEEYLTLSTIHSAKGLEWHSVFIIHAMDGFFPGAQSLEKLDQMEEERRLMYVAATRAKKNLYVSYPMHIFDRYNGYTISKRSRFLDGVDEKLAEEWILEE